MGGTLRAIHATPLAIGGTADYVHLLVGPQAIHRLADVLREVKGASSRFCGKRQAQPRAIRRPSGARWIWAAALRGRRCAGPRLPSAASPGRGRRRASTWPRAPRWRSANPRQPSSVLPGRGGSTRHEQHRRLGLEQRSDGDHGGRSVAFPRERTKRVGLKLLPVSAHYRAVEDRSRDARSKRDQVILVDSPSLCDNPGEGTLGAARWARHRVGIRPVERGHE